MYWTLPGCTGLRQPPLPCGAHPPVFFLSLWVRVGWCLGERCAPAAFPAGASFGPEHRQASPRCGPPGTSPPTPGPGRAASEGPGGAGRAGQSRARGSPAGSRPPGGPGTSFAKGTAAAGSPPTGTAGAAAGDASHRIFVYGDLSVCPAVCLFTVHLLGPPTDCCEMGFFVVVAFFFLFLLFFWGVGRRRSFSYGVFLFFFPPPWPFSREPIPSRSSRTPPGRRGSASCRCDGGGGGQGAVGSRERASPR